MAENTQKQYVIGRLRATGEIYRNECLNRRITRLGAIINTLNGDGWQISGSWHKTDKGKDYRYSLISEKPLSKYQLFHQKMQSL